MAPERNRSSIKQDRTRDVTVVRFTGRETSLDEETVQRIRDQLLGLADEQSEAHLFLDFGNVEYLSSTALDTLVTLHKKLFALGRHMIVGNLRPQVHEVFAATRLNELLNLRLAGREPGGLPHRRRDSWIETPAKGA
jgi:anti-anti-sigma factor